MPNKVATTVETSLKQENSYLKKLLRELKAENLKLQNKIAKIEAKHITAINRINALEKAKDPFGDIEKANTIRSMSSEELELKLKTLEKSMQ